MPPSRGTSGPTPFSTRSGSNLICSRRRGIIPISSLRFSAEMSLLLSVLMVVDALGAILLVPALIVLLPKSLAGRLA